MSIKGLSENVRLPRLGKIRLGIKVDGQKTYPKAVDYFVIPPEVQAKYGDKPKELPIMFPTENPEQWSSQFYRCYSNMRGLICKGDGERALAVVDTATGEFAGRDAKATELKDIPCDPDKCPKHTSDACKPVMNLQFLLPEVPGLGIWQLDTSSINSIKNINSAVALIQGVCGRISMMPLTLKVEPMEVSPDGKKKSIYVLQLTNQESLIETLGKLQALPVGKALLPEPDAEAPDDLFPQAVVEEPPAKAANSEEQQEPSDAEKALFGEQGESGPGAEPTDKVYDQTAFVAQVRRVNPKWDNTTTGATVESVLQDHMLKCPLDKWTGTWEEALAIVNKMTGKKLTPEVI